MNFARTTYVFTADGWPAMWSYLKTSGVVHMSKHPANHPVPFTPDDLGPDTVGTNDTFAAPNFLGAVIGDAGGVMFGHAQGGNDTLTAGTDYYMNALGGDSGGALFDHSVGGNDTLSGGDGAFLNVFAGDAGGMFDSSSGAMTGSLALLRS